MAHYHCTRCGDYTDGGYTLCDFCEREAQADFEAEQAYYAKLDAVDDVPVLDIEGEPYEDTYLPGIPDYDRFGRPSWEVAE